MKIHSIFLGKPSLESCGVLERPSSPRLAAPQNDTIHGYKSTFVLCTLQIAVLPCAGPRQTNPHVALHSKTLGGNTQGFSKRFSPFPIWVISAMEYCQEKACVHGLPWVLPTPGSKPPSNHPPQQSPFFFRRSIHHQVGTQHTRSSASLPSTARPLRGGGGTGACRGTAGWLPRTEADEMRQKAKWRLGSAKAHALCFYFSPWDELFFSDKFTPQKHRSFLDDKTSRQD